MPNPHVNPNPNPNPNPSPDPNLQPGGPTPTPPDPTPQLPNIAPPDLGTPATPTAPTPSQTQVPVAPRPTIESQLRGVEAIDAAELAASEEPDIQRVASRQNSLDIADAVRRGAQPQGQPPIQLERPTIEQALRQAPEAAPAIEEAAPAEISQAPQRTIKDIEAEATSRAAAKKTDGTPPTRQEINAEVMAIAKEIRAGQPAKPSKAAKKAAKKQAPKKQAAAPAPSATIPTLDQMQKMESGQIVATCINIIEKLVTGVIDPDQALLAAQRGMDQIGQHPILMVMQGISLGLKGDVKTGLDWLALAITVMPDTNGSRDLFTAIQTRLRPESRPEFGQAVSDAWQNTEDPTATDAENRMEQAIEPEPEPQPGFNISSYESGLGHALSNFAKMPVEFRGKKYASSEAAYQANKEGLDDASVLSLMVEIITAKLTQHPQLVEQIDARGGEAFLASATHDLVKNGKVIKADRWTGPDGLFMQALRQAYDNVTRQVAQNPFPDPRDYASYDEFMQAQNAWAKQPREQRTAQDSENYNYIYGIDQDMYRDVGGKPAWFKAVQEAMDAREQRAQRQVPVAPVSEMSQDAVVDATLDGMLPDWLREKDKRETDAYQAQLRQAVYDSAERLDRLESLEAVEDYLTAKENHIPQSAAWVQKIRQLIEMLSDPDTLFCSMDMEKIDEDLKGLFALIEEDSLQAKAARAEREAPKTEKAAAEDKKAAKESSEPVSRNWKKVVAARKQMRENLRTGVFKLDGDHPAEREVMKMGKDGVLALEKESYTAHSEEVTDAIADVLRSLGHKDESQYEALEIFLFRSFQILRGASIDQNGKWFGEEAESPEINDVDFIIAIKEIAASIAATGYPFSYLNPTVTLGGTYCFPMPITPGLADFYRANESSNPLNLSKQDYLDYGKNQWNETVKRQVTNNATPAQRKVLFNFVDAIVEQFPILSGKTADGKPGIEMRTPAEFVTMNQALDVSDEWAKAHNPVNMLADAALQDRERVVRATKRKGISGRAKPSSRFTKGVHKTFAGLNEIAILNQLVAKAGGWLMISGIMEKVQGLGNMNFVMWVMQEGAKRRVSKDPTGETIDPRPSKEMLQEISAPKAVAAITDALKIAGSSEGLAGLTLAAANGATFGQDAFIEISKAKKDESAPAQFSRYIQAKLQGTAHLITTISVGDFVGSKHMARLWLKSYCLYMSEAHKNGRPSFSPEQLEQMYREDPDGFFRDAMMRPEGQAALTFAAKSSIASHNLFTAALSRVIDDPVKQFIFGFFVTFFAKYQTNILLRHIPGSTFGMYLAKKGFNKALIASAKDEAGKKRAEGIAADTDLYNIGGQSKEFWDGAYQCMLVDFANLGSDMLIFGALLAFTTALGVEPPDEDEEDKGKIFRYDEWKIGGQTIEANWFWGDLLKFTMPAVIAIHAGVQAEKNGENGAELASKIFFYGAYEQLQENQWVRVTSMVDVMSTFMSHYEEQQVRTEDETIKVDNFIMLEIRSFMIRRGIAVFEPAAVREAYTETGLFGGAPHLDVSSTQINTPSVKDEPWETESTTYADARLRRDVKNSVVAGWIANLMTGFYGDDTNLDHTGYMRGDRPLITNVEPYSQMWVDKLTLRTESGEIVEYDPKHPEQYAEIVALVWPLINNPDYSAQVLAGSGIAIPYNARLAVDDALYQQAAALWTDYYTRLSNGEWIAEGGFDRDKVIAKMQEKQDAYNRTSKAVSDIYLLREKLWSDEIPYSAWKMNRTSTPFRTIVVWKEGTEHAGEVAPPWMADWNRDQVDVILYPTGEHKSNWLPWLTVDDVGEPSYDARPAVPWMNEFTDDQLVESSAKGYIIPSGIGAGEELLSLMTGGGATGMNPTKSGGWINEYLFPLRGYVKPSAEYTEQAMPEWDFTDLEKKAPEKSSGGGGGGGGWGGSSYSPNIYSRPGSNLNPDKPAGLYTKVPSFARFDYLRPSVQTKGSREAYRREDF